MATSWTNTIGVGGRILAFDVQEVINAINSSRSTAGLQSFSWTYSSPSSSDRVLAKRYVEMRQAIQGLWSSKGMGTVPNWSSGVTPSGESTGATPTRVYATDLTDLRSWVNQYENHNRNNNPKRGIHLRDADHRQEDYWMLNEYNPGSVVVMSPQLVNTDGTMSNNHKALADWLKSRCPYTTSPNNAANMEIFVRIYPSDLDRAVYEGSPNYGGVVDEVFRVYDKVYDYNGLIISRYLPGNEPNTEWDIDQSTSAAWGTIASYYTNVYNATQANKGTRNIELYTPPMAQQAFAEEYNIDGGGAFWLDGQQVIRGGYNVDSVKTMIQLYNSFSWHNYFMRNNAWQHRVEQFFPQWLQDHLWVDHAPARITEAGWKPEEDSNRDYDFGASAYWNDMNYFMRTATQAGGVMVWLISKQYSVRGENVWEHAAIANGVSSGDDTYNPDDDGTVTRPWISKLAVVAP